jgi:hypothetical protein
LIECYVGTKWSANVTKSSDWELYTKRAELHVEEDLCHATNGIVTKNSSIIFLVQLKRKTEVPLVFAVD